MHPRKFFTSSAHPWEGAYAEFTAYEPSLDCARGWLGSAAGAASCEEEPPKKPPRAWPMDVPTTAPLVTQKSESAYHSQVLQQWQPTPSRSEEVVIGAGLTQPY